MTTAVLLILSTMTSGCSDGDGQATSVQQSTAKSNSSDTAKGATPQPRQLSSFERLKLISDLAVRFNENPESKSEVVPELRKFLDDPELTVRLAAADAIVQTGEEFDAAQEVLLEGLSRDSAIASGRALNQIGESAMPSVLNALRSEDATTRKNAALSLGLTWSLAQLEDRIAALSEVVRDDGEAEVRGQAAVAVATLTRQDEVESDLKTRAIAVLTEALVDSSPVVRNRTAFSVGLIGHKAHPAIPAMISLLKDENSEVRGIAANSLGILASPYPVRRGRIIVDGGISSDGANPEVAAQAIAALIETLSDESPKVRAKAARGISHIGSQAREAVPALTSQLEDSETQPRLWAATALVKVTPDSKAAIAVLEEAVAEGDRAWKTKASRLLKELSVTPTEVDSSPAGLGK